MHIAQKVQLDWLDEENVDLSLQKIIYMDVQRDIMNVTDTGFTIKCADARRLFDSTILQPDSITCWPSSVQALVCRH